MEEEPGANTAFTQRPECLKVVDLGNSEEFLPVRVWCEVEKRCP